MYTLTVFRIGALSELVKQRPHSNGSTRAMAAAMLCTSAAAGDLVAMQHVLDNGGITVDDVNSDGRSALHSAASGGQLAAVRMLIAAGAKLDIEDRWGGTPLVDALRHHHLEVAPRPNFAHSH